jgi:hypothetical protein
MTELRANCSKAELIEEIQTRGAWAAYQASLAVCSDPKAAANARAQAASNILRAGGYFAARADDGSVKEAHEMTSDELQQAIKDLRRRASSSVFD